MSRLYQFIPNIGDSLRISQQVVSALLLNEPFSLEVSGLRRLRITNVSPTNIELTVQCKDTDKNDTVILHLPYAHYMAAQATIVQYDQEG